jgi:hypothetical protein
MSTSTYLATPGVAVNSISLTDQCIAATFLHRFDTLEKTTFGQNSRQFQAGLGSHEVTLSLYMSYAASETYQTLAALVGNDDITVVVDADGELFTLTNCALLEMPVVSATLGELSQIDITFVGGTYSVA